MTYPNVLIMGYLKEVGKLTPEASIKLEEAISAGYQRLLNFEVSGGGFDWHGSPPANVLLTAYGILEFHDMGQVYEVDEAVIRRAASWLSSQQRGDGSWDESRKPHSLRMADAMVSTTAFATWALAEAGLERPAAEAGRRFLLDHLDEVEDPYSAALAALALGRMNPKDAVFLKLIDRIVSEAKREKDQVWWENAGPTSMYGRGRAGHIETTALSALALNLAGSHPSVLNGALSYLIAAKDPGGAWYSTQATILSMKALLSGTSQPGAGGKAKIALKVNGADAADAQITEDNADVMQQFDLRQHLRTGENRVGLRMAGSANLSYQVVGRYYVPWKTPEPAEQEPLTIDVHYDRTTLAVDDTVDVRVTVGYHASEPTFMVIVDLGLPPGFTPDTAGLQELLSHPKINKYSVTGRQITIYLGELKPEDKVVFAYPLKAKYPIRAKAPESKVYAYYNPDQKAASAPVQLEVK